MAEIQQNNLELINERMAQLQNQLAVLTENHAQLLSIVEQLQETLLYEIKQRTIDQEDVQVVPSFDKNKEIAAYAEENRSFIQSIWKKKK